MKGEDEDGLTAKCALLTTVFYTSELHVMYLQISFTGLGAKEVHRSSKCHVRPLRCAEARRDPCMLVPYLQILHGVAAHHLQLEDRLLAWLLLSMRSTRLDSVPASRGGGG